MADVRGSRNPNCRCGYIKNRFAMSTNHFPFSMGTIKGGMVGARCGAAYFGWRFVTQRFPVLRRYAFLDFSSGILRGYSAVGTLARPSESVRHRWTRAHAQ
jgi:hypothetical protein